MITFSIYLNGFLIKKITNEKEITKYYDIEDILQVNVHVKQKNT